MVALSTADLVADDDCSVFTNSWSIKSKVGALQHQPLSFILSLSSLPHTRSGLAVNFKRVRECIK
ncbi:hypothetical protein E2542_SST28334 [Spatholobus suberectus]|nr:hypothetical protein E2542_SST28334 [Spatholobus suberectus]